MPTWGPVLGHSKFVKKDERNKVENHKSDNKDKKRNESTTKETKTDIIPDNNNRDQERE